MHQSILLYSQILFRLSVVTRARASLKTKVSTILQHHSIPKPCSPPNSTRTKTIQNPVRCNWKISDRDPSSPSPHALATQDWGPAGVASGPARPPAGITNQPQERSSVNSRARTNAKYMFGVIGKYPTEIPRLPRACLGDSGLRTGVRREKKY
jgi:hypothetical protein